MNHLETERLILRPFQEQDASFILVLLNSEGWIRFIGDRKVYTLDAAKNYLINGPLKSYTDHGFGLYIVLLKDNQTAIGMCGLVKRQGLDDVDLGFAFLPDFTGKGYAFESADAWLHHAFHQLNLRRVAAITLPENESSVALLGKLGMSFEKTILLPNDPTPLSYYTTVERSYTRPPFHHFPELKAERILLRKIDLNEAGSILEILFYNQKAAADINDAQKILRKVDCHYRAGQGINWGIVLPETNEIVGTIGFYRGFKNDTGEIGFVIKEKFRRQGFTLEAVKKLIDFGYHQMLFKKIIAYTNPDNTASQNLLRKAGFVSDSAIKEGYLEFVHSGSH